ncbi:ATP-dependent Zn protease [Mesorhizobium sp.]|uniref:ATP-dependent Zn protease n=1 Tax=Mesorhizobium sp. TaxID=1871066 RepID=UPI000FE53D24|nr:MAG: ATP-dependent Zn protease [Mesorhizobium sp.]
MTNPVRPEGPAAAGKPTVRPRGRKRNKTSSSGQSKANPDSPRTPARSPQLLCRMAVHEAGHAIARLCLGLGTLEMITIEAAEGGAISWRFDRLDDQTEDLLASVLVATLAGRAAEQEFIGSVAASSGGGPEFSDLALATDIAFQMEATLGFGQKCPLLYRATSEPALLLALDADLKERVDARLETAHAAARMLVHRHRNAVEFLAAHLIAHGTLEGAGLDQLVARIKETIHQ